MRSCVLSQGLVSLFRHRVESQLVAEITHVVFMRHANTPKKTCYTPDRCNRKIFFSIRTQRGAGWFFFFSTSPSSVCVHFLKYNSPVIFFVDKKTGGAAGCAVPVRCLVCLVSVWLVVLQYLAGPRGFDFQISIYFIFLCLGCFLIPY